MYDDAKRIASSVGYANAGTVEFMLAPDGSYYFLEVNPRVQVEHTITEEITGFDIVEAQLRITEGAKLAASAASSKWAGLHSPPAAEASTSSSAGAAEGAALAACSW